MIKQILFFCLLGLFAACTDGEKMGTKVADKTTTEKHDHDGHDHDDHAGHDHDGHDQDDHAGHDHSGHDHAAKTNRFGATIDEANAISYDDLLAQMKDKEELNVKVKGEVESVCQAKGCWMQLVDKEGETMRVTFKDYAFFVPKDISGKSVVVEGVAEKQEVSIADQKHYLEDAGASKEAIAAITSPKQELTFEATGVLLLNESK